MIRYMACQLSETTLTLPLNYTTVKGELHSTIRGWARCYLCLVVLCFPTHVASAASLTDQLSGGEQQPMAEPERRTTITDQNDDGQPDQWAVYVGEFPEAVWTDTNHDGRPDAWRSYGDGGLKFMWLDRDHDGQLDMWSTYEHGQRVRMEMDLNYDGTVDRRTEYNHNGRMVYLQMDRDETGELEVIFDRRAEEQRHVIERRPALKLPPRDVENE